VVRSDYLSWGRVLRPRQTVTRPAFMGDVAAILRGSRTSVLPFGMGRSYGDSCLNADAALIDVRALNRLIAFDRETGVLEVEAGVTLAEILQYLTAVSEPERSWFPAVSPGTKFVTVGGAIANDVHGKNHHSAGCFGNHVLSLRLLRSDGTTHLCSPSQETALFAATIGGLGLTGVILSAVLQMKSVPSLWLEVEDIRFEDLAAFDRLNAESADWEYTVAWTDCLARGPQLGRGIFTRARHAGRLGPPPPAMLRFRRSMPIDLPGFALNAASVTAFNALYWRRAPVTPTRRVSSYEPVFYPLDAIGQWNRIYGARGFHQYQCVVPTVTAPEAIPALLNAIAAARQGSFLAVLKTLGSRPSPGMLSFPMAGTTLALDFPNRGAATYDLLNRLDAITAAAGGRIYPAKDGRVSAGDFQRGFQNWRDFARHVDPHFSSSFWRRVTAPFESSSNS
jgi:FAD/FMN-containing dehydrogenase